MVALTFNYCAKAGLIMQSTQDTKSMARTLKNIRARLDQNQDEAADSVYVSRRCWQNWESGSRPISLAHYELYLIKSGQDI